MKVDRLGQVVPRLGALCLSVMAALVLVGPTPGQAGRDQPGSAILITLKNEFIEKYKDRVTIDTNFKVDVPGKIHKAKEDGDMHVAGRATEIGLATVAEIQNAKDVPDAVSAVKSVEGSGQTIALTGVWRIWPEHGGDNSHIQKNGPGPQHEGPGPTNPPHRFEIHPILKIAEQDISNPLRSVEGFAPKEAEEAFARYERGSFEITPDGDRVRMRMNMVGFNYVKFLMKVRKRFNREEDGEFISAAIYAPDEEELLVHDRRIGFVAGTAPDEKQKNVRVGQCILVLGIPQSISHSYRGVSDMVPMLCAGPCLTR